MEFLFTKSRDIAKELMNFARINFEYARPDLFIEKKGANQLIEYHTVCICNFEICLDEFV